MKTLKEIKKALLEGGIITTANKFLNSSITWTEDDIDPNDYMVEILIPDHSENIMITFVRDEEYFAGVRNSDFSEEIAEEKEKRDFLKELENNADIFEKRFFD